VYMPPVPASLLDGDGRPVVVSGRGDHAHAPARLACHLLPRGGGVVRSWAGPWAHDLRWWDARARSRRVLWQVVVDTDDGEVACLVAVEAGRASVAAIYD